MLEAVGAEMTTAKVLRQVEQVAQAAAAMVQEAAAPYPAARALLIPAVVVGVVVTARHLVAMAAQAAQVS